MIIYVFMTDPDNRQRAKDSAVMRHKGAEARARCQTVGNLRIHQGNILLRQRI